LRFPQRRGKEERACQPLTGALFEVHGLGVKGVPELLFGN
jgi:hypothetical protein